MYKIKTTSISDGSVAVVIPAETLANLGISAGDEIDLTETENALILRSAKESHRIREIEAATEKVFDRWDRVFVELAKGTDEK